VGGGVTALATVATPCGPFTVMVRGNSVVASGWTADPALLLAPLAPARRPAEWDVRPELGPFTRAITRYFAGDVAAIDAVVVEQHSGAFTEAAWRALRDVTAGETVSYQELAGLAGRPAAVRAAGRACGTNAAALFVPCHRARRSDAGLGGFRWGLATKRWLLDYEAGVAGRTIRL
jgi:methylated-DNA-[protein]-cysteine S-methyltransferase